MTSSRSLAAISIDVDGVRHYHAIHGLPPPEECGVTSDAPVELGLRRFLDLCARLEIPSTIFVVGRDVDDDVGERNNASGALRGMLRKAARDGHEIASHSHAHDYALSTRSPAEIQADIARSLDVIERAAGVRPRGFRAPGYNISEPLLDALETAGIAWDSSIMPSAAYWAARVAAIGAHKFMGTPSSSIVGSARDFAIAPRAPYRPRKGAHHKRARSRVDGRELVEVPIATALGAPWIGTTLAMSPLPAVAASTAAALSTSSPVVFELHAIDFCDKSDDFSPALVRLQRELRVPLKSKLARIESALRMIAQSRDVETVDVIARAAA